MERLGLVGLPNAGKSSLFNAMTGASVPVAAHPFSTTETHVGIAQVPDPRLRALAEMSRSRKVVGATLEFVDIAGLVAGSASGEGMGNRFLGGIRDADYDGPSGVPRFTSAGRPPPGSTSCSCASRANALPTISAARASAPGMRWL